MNLTIDEIYEIILLLGLFGYSIFITVKYNKLYNNTIKTINKLYNILLEKEKEVDIMQKLP